MLRVNMSHKFSHDFSVRVRFKSMSLLHKEQLDVLVVSDDSIVDEDEGIVIIRPMGMSVDGTWHSVSGPSGVSNSNVS